MSLSAHLIDAHETDQKQIIQPPPPAYGIAYIPLHRPSHLPIPQHNTSFPRSNTSISNSRMDGNDTTWMGAHGQSFMSNGGVSQWSEERIHMLQARLARKLGPEYVTQRPGPGGGPKLSYIEGWKVINLANEVFGFNGWSSSIVSLTTDYLDVNEQGRVSVNVTAIIRITLQDGCFHEDVGCGQGENIRGKGAALDKAKKEAVTDATKRALKTFGNVLGNCLYDKDYTKEVVKMKVPPAKFNTSDLERRPEFMEAGAAGPSRPAAIPQHMNAALRPAAPTNIIPQNLRPAARQSPPVAPGTPLRSIHDAQETDVMMEESFDAEFMGMGSDSFLDQLDEQSFQVNAAGSKPLPADLHPQAGPSRSSVVPVPPAYQHRHRPDPPSKPAQMPQSRDQSGLGSKVQQQASVSPVRLENPVDELRSDITPDDGNNRGQSSSSGSDQTVAETNPKPRVVGGFGLASSTTTVVTSSTTVNAKSARALAIAAALKAQAQQPPPIRAESPRIPSGGIDAVAAKASQTFRAHAAHLGLDENEVEDDGLSKAAATAAGAGAGQTFGGFASARGVKRTGQHEERMSASPTKPPSSGGSSHRSAPRKALGELPVGGPQDDWGAKRSRVG